MVYPLYLNGQTCTGNSISGTIRLDADANGCGTNDPAASNIAVGLILNNTIYYTYTNNFGYYNFGNLAEGVYHVFLASLPADYASAEMDYTIDVTGTGQSYGKDWCLTIPAPVTDAAVYFYPNMNARPGFQVSYTMYVQNIGTTSFSGNAQLNFDTSKLIFTSAYPAETSLISNTLNFYIDNIPPFGWRTFTVYFTVMQPPTANQGDVLTFDFNMDTVNLDANVANNHATVYQMIVNSYDPNDITVQQGAEILQNQVAEDLNYTIRFQNTGNAEAINVKIIADLDAKLDWESFRPVMSSHEFTTQRIGNEVTFTFNNINLPGSDNEPQSHGYITYKVKPKATLAVGDIISADADIYFDFNAAVATNTVTTELVSLMNVDNPNFANLEMAPNPASDKVNIRFNEKIAEATITLYDIQGKLILQHIAQNDATSIDVSKLSHGMYFVKIVSGSKAVVKKLMIK
ncbi:DUF7619 domain-containing protein [Flavobacterium sp. 3HN19-14]|uniref:DUF7619 domain-containing protein n=1 Tax=Flavobacterium sp. 3HN19-14 TaxID=3448133 RepID=UPI003EE384EC